MKDITFLKMVDLHGEKTPRRPSFWNDPQFTKLRKKGLVRWRKMSNRYRWVEITDKGRKALGPK